MLRYIFFVKAHTCHETGTVSRTGMCVILDACNVMWFDCKVMLMIELYGKVKVALNWMYIC